MKKIIALLLSVLFVFSGCVQATEIVDLSDYENLNKIYIDPVGVSAIASFSWDNAEEINPDYFITFYFLKSGERSFHRENINSDAEILSKEVEAYAMDYFNATASHVRTSGLYDERKGCYYFGGVAGGSSSRVVNAQQEGNILTLDYEYFGGSEDKVFRIGTLTIELTGKGKYIYQACETHSV